MSVAIIAGIILLVAILLLVLRSRAVEDIQVSVSQIPAVVSQLGITGKDSSFVVFLFVPEWKSVHDDEEGVNLQYSIENGRVGLDWVLLAPQNIADKDRIATFIEHHGFAVSAREMNKVRYLRVEDGEVPELGVQIATEFYKLNSDKQISMIVDGFDWTP